MSDDRPRFLCAICRRLVVRGRWNTFGYCTMCIGFTRREAVLNAHRYKQARLRRLRNLQSVADALGGEP